jgi:hypothetical protein
VADAGEIGERISSLINGLHQLGVQPGALQVGPRDGVSFETRKTRNLAYHCLRKNGWIVEIIGVMR